ncbi:hypothetical protein ACXWYY_002922 [Enterobacter hormaechei]
MINYINTLKYLFGVKFNAPVHQEDDHLWMEINDTQRLFLTLSYDQEEDGIFSLNISVILGIIEDKFPRYILTEFLHNNISLSIFNGPRYAYFEKTKHLSLIDRIKPVKESENELCDLISDMLIVASRTKEMLSSNGYSLEIEDIN